jgi:hypothetical protein
LGKECKNITIVVIINEGNTIGKHFYQEPYYIVVMAENGKMVIKVY